jgi:type IV pilus assembly protein PilE
VSAKTDSGRQRGFTLIELMIVVVLICIVMALGVPGYRQYSRRVHRADGMIELMRLAAAQEKFYIQNGTYASNAQLTAAAPAGLGHGGMSERGDYSVAIAPHAIGLAVGYTVTATVVPEALGGTQEDDTDCPSFSIDQSGLRGANGGIVVTEVEKCWR